MKAQIVKWWKGALKAASTIKEGDAISHSEQRDRMTLASGLVTKIAGSGSLSLRKKGGKKQRRQVDSNSLSATMGGMKFARKTTSLLCAALTITSATAKEAWTITSQEDWSAASASHTGLTLIDGAISPKENAGTFQSNLKKFDQKRSVTSITLNHLQFGRIGTPSKIWDRPTSPMLRCCSR